MQTFISHNEDQTQAIGKNFAIRLVNGSVVALYGELGSGKTQFIKGICEGLGVNITINSPTFIIVNEYSSSNNGMIYHFDLFRMKSKDEILELGFEEYIDSGNIILIEWPEMIEDILPPDTNKIYLSHFDTKETMRKIKILEKEK